MKFSDESALLVNMDQATETMSRPFFIFGALEAVLIDLFCQGRARAERKFAPLQDRIALSSGVILRSEIVPHCASVALPTTGLLPNKKSIQPGLVNGLFL